MQVNVHEAKTRLSHLLELVEQGETVTIARHGKPIAQIVAIQKQGLPMGSAANHPIVPTGDDWWQPMTDSEAEDWIEGK